MSQASTPTGYPSLDEALGVGGYPRGRIIEIFGPALSGKTKLGLHAVAEAQRLGGVAAFIDAEHAFDPTRAWWLGVRTEHLLLSQPDNGEQALEITRTLVMSGTVRLIVVDSVAALNDPPVELMARLMSATLRKLAPVAHKNGTTLIFVNEHCPRIGVTFGNPKVPPGGNALKYYASIRLDVQRVGQNTAWVKVVKNKCAPPFRQVEIIIIE